MCGSITRSDCEPDALSTLDEISASELIRNLEGRRE